MPLPRFANLDPARQEAILEAGADEFAAHGPARASINRILSAAGTSKGSFYYYFSDKADLYGAVVSREVHVVMGALDPLDDVADAEAFWARLEQMMMGALARLAERPRGAELLRGLYTAEAAAPVLEQVLDDLRGWMDAVLVTGQRVGAVRDDLPRELLSAATVGLSSAVDRWVALRMDTLSPDELIAVSVGGLDLLRGMLAPRG